MPIGTIFSFVYIDLFFSSLLSLVLPRGVSPYGKIVCGETVHGSGKKTLTSTLNLLKAVRDFVHSR